jgi:hypothetical protein
MQHDSVRPHRSSIYPSYHQLLHPFHRPAFLNPSPAFCIGTGRICCIPTSFYNPFAMDCMSLLPVCTFCAAAFLKYCFGLISVRFFFPLLRTGTGTVSVSAIRTSLSRIRFSSLHWFPILPFFRVKYRANYGLGYARRAVYAFTIYFLFWACDACKRCSFLLELGSFWVFLGGN